MRNWAWTMEKVSIKADRTGEGGVLLIQVARRYVALEKAIREVIDRFVGPVCAQCQRVCCKASYCRNTLLNPWYHYLFEQVEGAIPLPWERREPPPGLGPNGCLIRAGRYAYCYAYNCKAIRASFKSKEAFNAFQELSDLLKNVGLGFVGKRHLTDVRSWDEITVPRLKGLDKKIEEGMERFTELHSLLFMVKPGD